MRNFLLLTVALGCCLWQPLKAQERRITGTVTDAATGMALPGVNVRVEGSALGTATNLDGQYALEASPTDVLVFTFVGYVQEQTTVGQRSVIDIQLEEDVEQLEEVVVIGYGVQEKKDVTGAVESVSSEDFNQGIIVSPEQLIQGKSAGVQITQASGEPGSGVNIRIRGTSSVRANNNPLFVVDGIPLAGDEVSGGAQDIGRGTGSARNPLNFLNPNDIASMDILKGPSATAIYGSRGANGVVLITTKSGYGKQSRLEYSSLFSISEPANRYDLLDREQFLTAVRDFGGDVDAVDEGYDTDWQDVTFRSPFSHKQDLAYSDAYETGAYRVSIGYQDQQGIVENSGFERFSGRINWNQNLFDDRFHIGVQATGSRLNDEQAPIFNTTGFEGDLLGATYTGNPTWSSDPTIQPSNTVATPAAYLEYFLDETETDRFLINLSADYDITDELNFKVRGGYDNSSSFRGAAFSKELAIGNGINGNGRAFIGEIDTDNYLLEAFANYRKEWENNTTLTALLGYSYQEFNRKGINVLGWGFRGSFMETMIDQLETSSDIIRNEITGPYQQFGLYADDYFIQSPFTDPNIRRPGTRPSTPVSSVAGDAYETVDELQSFFGRLGYNLFDRYLFTFTMRADGSTKFGGNNKYGYFPSGAFAWRLDEEEFIPDLFQSLKLRVEYGITGNQEIPHNLHQRRQRFGGISINEDGTILPPGLSDVSFANDELSWEETSQANIGLDFGFGTGRFNGSLDFYRKVTTDLLIRINSAQPAPQPFVFQNLDAEVINEGIELILNYIVASEDDYSIEISANGSYNNNKVENYDGPPLNTGQINGQGLTGAYAQRIANGQPLYAYFLREFTGINDEGQSEYVIDAQQFIDKQPLPKYNVGFNANFRYKQFDLAAYMYGQFGHYIYNNTTNAFFTLGSIASGRNITEEALAEARATGESIANTPDASTRYLEKGDFFRMQNLILGYNPQFENSVIKSLRIFANVQNLFVITDYSGLDPEVNIDKSLNDIPSAGIDYTSYPRPRIYSLGLNVTF